MVKIINLKLFYLLFPGVKKMYLFRKHKRPWAPLPLSIIIKWFSPPKLYPGNTSSLTSLIAPAEYQLDRRESENASGPPVTMIVAYTALFCAYARFVHEATGLYCSIFRQS